VQNNLRNKLNNDINGINLNANIENTKINAIDKSEIKINQEVYVSNLKQNGIILSNISKSNEVLVQIGSMKINIPIKYLEKSKKEKSAKPISNNYTSISKTRNAKTEINVIGYTVEEAIFVVDKFLDDCSLAKIKTARIVHGKGTGKLKNGIHQFLKNHPHVSSYRMGTYGEGEMGVTVVELK
jgi:DNA mismatch repair protein MutS2